MRNIELLKYSFDIPKLSLSNPFASVANEDENKGLIQINPLAALISGVGTHTTRHGLDVLGNVQNTIPKFFDDAAKLDPEIGRLHREMLANPTADFENAKRLKAMRKRMLDKGMAGDLVRNYVGMSQAGLDNPFGDVYLRANRANAWLQKKRKGADIGKINYGVAHLDSFGENARRALEHWNWEAVQDPAKNSLMKSLNKAGLGGDNMASALEQIMFGHRKGLAGNTDKSVRAVEKLLKLKGFDPKSRTAKSFIDSIRQGGFLSDALEAAGGGTDLATVDRAMRIIENDETTGKAILDKLLHNKLDPALKYDGKFRRLMSIPGLPWLTKHKTPAAILAGMGLGLGSGAVL